MLRRLRVSGFKSLADVDVQFPRLAVFFGPNAAGKSNVIDAVQVLSRLGTESTLSDALSDPIRGIPLETLSFPSGGMAALLEERAAQFTIDAELELAKETYQYRVSVGVRPRTGALTVEDERLARLSRSSGREIGKPRIERQGDEIHIRSSDRGRPNVEPLHQNHTKLSDPRLIGSRFTPIEKCRAELRGWRTYYLDPRVSMRREASPKEAHDIGMLGEDTAPFLYRLREEEPKHYEAVVRTLRMLIPSVEQVEVDLDKRRGTLDIMIRQNGVDYSSRIISEGTLRILALCAIALNPWGGSLLAFEEPENGVHPRRLELVAKVLASLAMERGRQLIVTTHSPVFCDAILKMARPCPDDIGLLNVRRTGRTTKIVPFEATGPLFQNIEIDDGLETDEEDGAFSRLMMRGLIDE